MSYLSPIIGTALYFGIALLIGFIGMMYFHAMESQGKRTELEPPIIMMISLVWIVSVPLLICVGTASLMSYLAKKASFILTSKEEE